MMFMSFVLFVLLCWAFAHFYLSGPSLAQYDQTLNVPQNHERRASPEHSDVIKQLQKLTQGSGTGSRLSRMRAAMDSIGDSADLQDITLTTVNTPDVKGEWVVAENSDPNRRLLYIHGGAFMSGSPLSHRTITTKYARLLGVSVFAVDYRMLPEHGRLDCLADCQDAYRYVLDNGPEQSGAPAQLLVSGDSAGGNLALVVTAWARDQGLRKADGVIAIAPATDNTFSSPTLQKNAGTDPLLGPTLGKMIKLPRAVLLYFSWISTRLHPADTRVSPIHGDLSALPPMLIHASEAEMLLGDARRYTNKANAQGSSVKLETWNHMVHVWHVFEPDLPEAKQAFDHIAKFVENLPATATAPVPEDLHSAQS
ncbi:MAG: alpha/beta hydrolase [Pseudomonadaceae bacterium]|nr:alpha/beta hydrolase [Pseudomonadaceae bacterium]